MLKLPKLPNNLGIQSVNNYYKKCNLKERLLFEKIEPDKTNANPKINILMSENIGQRRLNFVLYQSDKALKILKDFHESKAPGIDYLSGIFLKYGASVLATPVTQLWNL